MQLNACGIKMLYGTERVDDKVSMLPRAVGL
jgi:hypothetical protein